MYQRGGMMSKNDLEINHGLILQEQLGKGGFSTVWKALDINKNEIVAVKIGNGHQSNAHDAEKEILALESLAAVSGILHIRRHFTDSRWSGDITYIVMEYGNGEELLSVVRRNRHLSEKEAQINIRKIIEIVSDIHGAGWVHRDLKLENTLTHKDSVLVNKIIDFGFATEQVEPGLHTSGILGTAAYTAPEVILNNTYDGRAVDMYAIGVILYLMLFGMYPFPERGLSGVTQGRANNTSFRQKFIDPVVKFPSSGLVSQAAKQTIQWLLHNDPAVRPTADQALTIAWITQGQERVDSSAELHESQDIMTTTSEDARRRQASRELTPGEAAAEHEGREEEVCAQGAEGAPQGWFSRIFGCTTTPVQEYDEQDDAELDAF